MLMRYTLRLLTLQQFQRATALICACESIRREALAKGDARWGQTPFRIGLWVGRTDHAQLDRATRPRHSSWIAGRQAKARQRRAWLALPAHVLPVVRQRDRQGRHGSRPTPRAGRTLDLLRRRPSARACFRGGWPRTRGLPGVVVDEEIYRRLPSLLIATVDKFAQMPWNGEVQMLFGQVDGHCDRHGFRSPDELEGLAIDAPPSEGRMPCGQGDAAQPAPPAGSDHPGRAAPHQRPAGYPGRPLRDGRRRAVHLGRGRQAGSAQGDRLDRHDSPARGDRSTRCSAE